MRCVLIKFLKIVFIIKKFALKAVTLMTVCLRSYSYSIQSIHLNSKPIYLDWNMVPFVFVRIWYNCETMSVTFCVVAGSEFSLVTVLLHASAMASFGHWK